MGRMRGASEELRGRARALRREMTPAEVRLWNALRGWGIAKFRRQHPLDRFVLDFHCPAARLRVEVDGAVHEEEAQRESDAARDDALAARGVHVLRLSDAEVLSDTWALLRRIRAALRDPAPPTKKEPASADSPSHCADPATARQSLPLARLRERDRRGAQRRARVRAG